jgi:hypothetical protein
MRNDRPIRVAPAQFALVLIIAILSFPSNAQAPARTPYAAPGDWTVTTYRAGDTGAFLRCSAERHYEAQALTVAKNAAGKFVLGFTSNEWTFEDRSTHPISVRIDSGEEVMLSGRVRLLPSGPIVFVDIEMDSAVIAEISAGSSLQVISGETSLVMDLAGSAAAIASTNQCHVDASD